MTFQKIALDTTHAKIHAGRAFVFTTLTTAYTTGSPCEVHITTGTAGCHLSLVGTSGGGAVLSLYEAPVAATTGFLTPAQNRNRFSSTTHLTALRTNPVVTTAGTLLWASLIPGGTGVRAQGGGGELNGEVVLATNQTYLVRLENLTTAQPGGIECRFYEIASGETAGGLA
jgi:hypothetical protein